MIKLDDMLNQLTKEQAVEVITWALNDLQDWTNNGSRAEITQFCAMEHEAIRYQIDKAISK